MAIDDHEEGECARVGWEMVCEKRLTNRQIGRQITQMLPKVGTSTTHETAAVKLVTKHCNGLNYEAGEKRLRLGVTYENVTLGNVTMSHRTRERPAECLASLPLNYDRSAARAALEN
ncbi:hypothetical protein EVAR_21209_1 [Eumeta japonica]|uniref:Uncharacterized protein n=1 Tax=Eumeta variegata TaxID=151549 RepID=A0A4C1UNP1_EUMVA|nr:hypothetical protein EVAR_21209_1 [Eumeta japonica]